MGEGATQVASACRLVAAVGICAIASGRCLVLASWTPLFDLDPALTADLPAAIGPATGVGLDIIVLVLCGVGLWGEAGRGRGLQRRLLLLGAAGSGAVLWHGLQDPAHLWHGGAWIAAIFAAITLSHLARGRRVAVLAPAILCAVAAPLVIREAIQWLIEHPDTIDWFKEHGSDALALRGLTPDTPQAALLEERLMAAEPAAWFSSPNVLAAVLSALAATWLGWARAAAWRLEGGWPVAAILIAAACGSGALLTGAKSAPLLLAIAGGLLVLCSCNVTRTLLQRRGGLVAIALIAAAIGVVSSCTSTPSHPPTGMPSRTRPSARRITASAGRIAGRPSCSIAIPANVPSFVNTKAPFARSVCAGAAQIGSDHTELASG